MKIVHFLIPFLVSVVFFLIRAELRNTKRQIYIFKPLATLLVIVVALLSFGDSAYNQVYSVGVVVGLLLSLGGDLALMFQENRKAFTLGLVLFLLAHVAYTIVFTALSRLTAWDILSTLVLAVAGIGFYRLIHTNLGKMRVPVIAYILVISLMVSRACATLASPLFTPGQAAMVAVGAVLFYVSDIILAASRFWKPWRYHRLSLAFYYTGQLLIALVASYFTSYL